MEKILTICIPTYNRASIVKEDVERYLSIADERFEVKVCDNNSSDSTYEYLEGIQDNRLRFKRNATNIGAIQNMFESLKNNNSKYSILVLDKDLLDVSLLSDFLDVLETSTEDFGFVDPDVRLSKLVGTPDKLSYARGYDSVYRMAYLSMHPSGYIYNSKLIDKVCDSNVFLSLDKNFVFPFEVINADLALNYASFVFRLPLIIRARERHEDPCSITYNQSNLWYSASYRIYVYTTYVDNVFTLKISLREKKALVNYLTQKVLNETTFILRTLMKDEYACTHYKIKTSNIGFVEMHQNIMKVLKSLKTTTASHLSSFYVFCISVKYYLVHNVKIIKFLLLSNTRM